jgi:hypothetical protein
MREWWTYRLSDILPFSQQTYFRLFELLNAAIWPAQLLAAAIGVALIALLTFPTVWSGRGIALLLAAAWSFVAWAYLGTRYAALNWAASYFAWAFATQAVLLVASGALAGRLTFSGPRPHGARVGVAAVLFALLIQPLIGPGLGRAWSGVELFGVAPDPTVLATLGVLLAADRMRPELFVIPLLWCCITGAVLWALDAPDALLMPAAGFLILILALRRSPFNSTRPRR